MAAPHIYAYLDYRAFLRDWLAHQKRIEPGYSYAAFAQAGGCAKATISNVIHGARIPRPATLDAFARAMGLQPAERNYLGLLVELATAADLTARRRVMEQLLSREAYRQVRMADSEDEEAVVRYLEHWSIAAIRELATLPGFRADPDWLAATLRPPIGPERARRSLEVLFELGFLAHGDDGTVEPREVRFRTAPETEHRAAAHVHTVVIPELLRTADLSLADQQHLLTATLTVAASELPEFKARLNAVYEQLCTQADDRVDDEPRAVYQLGFQLLPLSERMPPD